MGERDATMATCAAARSTACCCCFCCRLRSASAVAWEPARGGGLLLLLADELPGAPLAQPRADAMGREEVKPEYRLLAASARGPPAAADAAAAASASLAVTRSVGDSHLRCCCCCCCCWACREEGEEEAARWGSKGALSSSPVLLLSLPLSGPAVLGTGTMLDMRGGGGREGMSARGAGEGEALAPLLPSAGAP